MYQTAITSAIDKFFPLITTKRKSTDLPWINKQIRKLVRKRKAIFLREGRSARWKIQKDRTNILIETRMLKYFAGKKKHILADDANRVFFKNVRRYQSADKPAEFDIRSLCPGETDAQVAEKLAEYFN